MPLHGITDLNPTWIYLGRQTDAQFNRPYTDDPKFLVGELNGGYLVFIKTAGYRLTATIDNASGPMCEATRCKTMLNKMIQAVISGAEPQFQPIPECLHCDIQGEFFPQMEVKPIPCCTASGGTGQCADSTLVVPNAERPCSNISVASNQSRLAAVTQIAGLQDQTDTSNQGYAIGDPPASAFDFDRSTSSLLVKTLQIGINDFAFLGQQRLQGSALLGGTVTADVVPGDPNSYTIPAGAAKFGINASDPDGHHYALGASNSTPLVISGMNDGIGPRMSGTLTGTLQGHTVDATLQNTQFAWTNRPPVAVAQVCNVKFDSSRMPGAPTTPRKLTCPNGARTTWSGIPGATVPVRLNGSGSYDPDPLDSLVYSWDLGKGFATSGTQPVQSIALPQGSYAAFLTVQDQNFVSAVTSTNFVVTDVANPCTPLTGSTRPKIAKPKFQTQLLPADVAPITDVTCTSVDPSARPEVAISPLSKPDIVTMTKAAAGRKAIATRIFRVGHKPNFGVANLRAMTFNDPYGTLCPSDTTGLTGGMMAVCSGCGNGICSEGETCETCPADCSACSFCGNGRCEPGGGESCLTCSIDCGPCDTCGDGHCEQGETCPQDCYCGDGLCARDEDHNSCAKDCYCGNSTCDSGETSVACPNDCRCGDGICDASESFASCPQDCTCGDGVCNGADTCATCPGDCGDCPRTVFVTFQYLNGADLAGIATTAGCTGGHRGLCAADYVCQQEAQGESLPGTYKAWLSDSTLAAKDRLTHSTGPYVMVDGTPIANDWTDLTDGTLDAAITLTSGGANFGTGGAWTATTPAGDISAPDTCSDWIDGSAADFGADGFVGSANGDWTQNSVVPIDRCNVQSRLYCFQQ